MLLRSILCVIATACLIGCTVPRARLATPPEGFLELGSERGPSEVSWRATTASGGRLVVRGFADPDHGSLDFWTEALRFDLEERGYRHVETDAVKDADGHDGRCMHFSIRANGRDRGYLIALFAGAGRIRTVEFTAERAEFDAHVEDVERALASLR